MNAVLWFYSLSWKFEATEKVARDQWYWFIVTE